VAAARSRRSRRTSASICLPPRVARHWPGTPGCRGRRAHGRRGRTERPGQHAPRGGGHRRAAGRPRRRRRQPPRPRNAPEPAAGGRTSVPPRLPRARWAPGARGPVRAAHRVTGTVVGVLIAGLIIAPAVTTSSSERSRTVPAPSSASGGLRATGVFLVLPPSCRTPDARGTPRERDASAAADRFVLTAARRWRTVTAATSFPRKGALR
jgi:hypothetical protein